MKKKSMMGGEKQKLLDFVARRQEVGLKKYGHGVRREDDTRAYGTVNDCWWEMAQEELGVRLLGVHL